MEIHLKEVLATTRRMTEILTFHSGRSREEVEHDLDRDYFMTAEEAVTWGLIDDILIPRRGVSAPPVAAAS
jgi:ATP-dependent Clp protease protease subunit